MSIRGQRSNETVNKHVSMKSAVSWEFPVILTVSVGFASIVYFQLDFRTVLSFGLKSFLVLSVLVFGTQFIVTQLGRFWKSSKKQSTEEEAVRQHSLEEKSKLSREDVQNKYSQEVESYRERVLVPREEARKAQKEEEFYKFLGPAWKGRGDTLGGGQGEGRSAGGQRSERDDRGAAELRQLPVTVVEDAPEPAKPRQKREIRLPDEPPEGASDSVTIVLRTPFGTSHRRRFSTDCRLQVLLDYMCTFGFHPGSYTLATSYPRRTLSDDSEKSLQELGFHRQVLLNVEEKGL